MAKDYSAGLYMRDQRRVLPKQRTVSQERQDPYTRSIDVDVPGRGVG